MGDAVCAAAYTGLHVVVPSADGNVYIVEGGTGCVNRVDIGETRYVFVCVCVWGGGQCGAMLFVVVCLRLCA